MEVKDIIALIMTVVFLGAMGFMWLHTRNEEKGKRQEEKDEV